MGLVLVFYGEKSRCNIDKKSSGHYGLSFFYVYNESSLVNESYIDRRTHGSAGSQGTVDLVVPESLDKGAVGPFSLIVVDQGLLAQVIIETRSPFTGAKPGRG